MRMFCLRQVGGIFCGRNFLPLDFVVLINQIPVAQGIKRSQASFCAEKNSLRGVFSGCFLCYFPLAADTKSFFARKRGGFI